MPSVEIDIQSEEVLNLLDGIERGRDELLGNITKEVGDAVFGASQQLCPVDTGTLKKSGYRQPRGKDFIIGYRANYASYVEYGTRKMAPRAYIRGAWGRIKPRVPKIAQNVIERLLKRMGG